jgi:hypothetical protein
VRAASIDCFDLLKTAVYGQNMLRLLQNVDNKGGFLYLRRAN